MSSRGFADARSRQAPPPDIKLQSTAEKRVREARAIGGTSVPPACSRASPGRVPCAVESFSGVLFQPTPRGPARGAGVRCGYGGHPSSPATFVSIHANLASPGRKELPGFRKDDRGSACEPVQGPNAYNVVLRVFVMEVLDRSRPLPHISCGYPDTPPPDIDLQHASR